ncbi:hypothetical protein Scep_009076 [Stephania cephalantha]|uniref:Transcription factor CBF/NF-Y/archaeal histone domain-containing protein n=1 Tax=Stephania cephalantha TaxID=152367 RepID=A0AAP0JUT3_9MAGN
MADINGGDDRLKLKIARGSSSSTTTTTTGSHEDHDHHHETDQQGYYCIKEQDRLLPIANVGRIMKQTLPTNAKISKEAKETMQECVSEFISFVTGEASDKCHKEKRKTINGDDICWAMSSLGFDNYVEPLKRYLQKYRELEGERANHNKQQASSSTGDDHDHHYKDESSIYNHEKSSQSSSSAHLTPFNFDFIH